MRAPAQALLRLVFALALGGGQLGVDATLARSLQHSGGLRIEAGPEVGSALVAAAQRLLGPYLSGPVEAQVLLALGSAPEGRALVSESEVAELPSEDAFIVRSGPLAPPLVRNTTVGSMLITCVGRSRRSTGYALFELLQLLGFAFLHPLKPVLPNSLPQPLPTLNVWQTPRWEFRGTHYHTQHPLELTNLLNGYDAKSSSINEKRWAAALPAWEAYLEWMLAQKQSYMEWLLLADRKVGAGGIQSRFQTSRRRQKRLQKLVAAAHARGIEVGVDVPLTLQQQHALTLLPKDTGNHQQNVKQVRKRVRWVVACGFDHLGTELGTTEFTSGLPAQQQVQLLNAVKEELGPKRRLLVKNHCSTKQKAKGYLDPRPGMEGHPLNFNYLNYYANETIVSMPHTVQSYALTGPAPTYGNQNFSDLRNWTGFLLEKGRPVVFYPETAYWVNFDMSVPLFLAPLYSTIRLEDAQDLDSVATSAGTPMLGQLNFESGWQWGYWLANSVQAYSAWARPLGSPQQQLRRVLTRLLGYLQPTVRAPLVELVVQMAEEERRLFVQGLWRDGERLVKTEPGPGLGPGSDTGLGYLQGMEGLSDFLALVARWVGEGAPQPDRLRPPDMWGDPPLSTALLLLPVFGKTPEALPQLLTGDRRIIHRRRQWYRESLRPLLSDMNSTFDGLAKQFQKLLPSDDSAATDSIKDLVISAEMLSLRCAQVFALYDHAVECSQKARAQSKDKASWCDDRLSAARNALVKAMSMVPEREAHYGLEKLGGGGDHMVYEWRKPVPTAYSYGYLWGVHHLFYWQRDQAIVERRILNPCFGTINDPVELGLKGGGGELSHKVRDLLQSILSNRLWDVGLAGCLAAPQEEPFPMDTLDSCSGEYGDYFCRRSSAGLSGGLLQVPV